MALSPVTMYRSTIGKKAVMAVTGMVLIGYVVAHMIGNLKFFFGVSPFDDYAAWLREIGHPILPHGWFLWIVRAILLACVVLHIVAAVQLARRDRAARPIRYEHRQRARANYPVWTMRWGGVVLALFVIYHILDLTVGVLNPDYQHGKVHNNVSADFELWYVALAYIVAMIALGFHLHHGVWSLVQTLGRNNPTIDRGLRAFALLFAVVTAGGFISVPLAIISGLAN